ncbi:g10738 [Coccomyxa elongata]
MGTSSQQLWTSLALCALVLCCRVDLCEGRASNEETTPAPAPALARRGGASRRSTKPALNRAPGPAPAPAPRGTAAARGQQGAVARSAAAAGEPRSVPQPAVGSATVTRLAAIRAPTPDIIRAPIPAAPVAENAPKPETPVSRTAPTAAPDAATTLFVISAKSATVTQLGRSRNASITLEGVDPWATWFVDRPVRRGGRIMAERFFGQDFWDNDSWVDFPDIAMYSSGVAGLGDQGDRVMVISVASNPRYSNYTQATSTMSTMSILSDGSVSIPLVTLGKSNTGEDTVAGYYSGIRGTLENGPTVINGTALGRTRNAVFSNVALFVETSRCGCSVLDSCGCQNAAREGASI